MLKSPLLARWREAAKRQKKKQTEYVNKVGLTEARLKSLFVWKMVDVWLTVAFLEQSVLCVPSTRQINEKGLRSWNHWRLCKNPDLNCWSQWLFISQISHCEPLEDTLLARSSQRHANPMWLHFRPNWAALREHAWGKDLCRDQWLSLLPQLLWLARGYALTTMSAAKSYKTSQHGIAGRKSSLCVKASGLSKPLDNEKA